MKDLPAKTVLTKEEKLQRQWDKKFRDLKIHRAKAGVFRNEVLEAYSIVDRLRFDYLGDTAFRDKVTDAKKAFEETIDDFLLSDNYWEQKIKLFRKNTPKEYDKYLRDMSNLEASSSNSI